MAKHQFAGRPRALVGIAWAIACVATAIGEDAKEPGWRRYREGPMTLADFQKPPPSPLPRSGRLQLRARTWTELMYRYRYQGDVENGKAKATATEVDLFAVIHRDKSWNGFPKDRALLDHEQGHFDLAEIAARGARKLLKERVTEKVLTGEGPDRASAKADLARKIEFYLRAFTRQRDLADTAYDEQTRHGSNRAVQAEHRKKQLEQLRASQEKDEK
ncbi:MAG: hypothetical protein N2C14_00235 [Planctomycetales bacterium]